LADAHERREYLLSQAIEQERRLPVETAAAHGGHEMPHEALCRRGLEQHGRLARGYLARVQPLYRALAGAPPDALRGRHLGRIAAGFVPIVALHLVVLPRDQAAPDAMARGWIAREKPQGVAVN